MASQILSHSKTCRKCGEVKALSDFSASKKHSDACKRCRNKYVAERRALNPESYREASRRSRKKRAESAREPAQKLEDKKKKSARQKKWRMKNVASIYASNAARRASKIAATPRWLSHDQIQEMLDMYEAAACFRMYTGAEYHVDHIVPLVNKKVCGLHVPWNLQILPAKENLKKNNRIVGH